MASFNVIPCLIMIFYLHGFRSSPESLKARQLKAALNEQSLGHRWWSEALPPSPKAAIEQVENALRRSESRPLLVGSSLGGYYATYLSERHGTRAILVNPATKAFDALSPWVGSHRNLYTGVDFDLTQQHLEELRDLWVPHLHHPERFWLMVETGDEVIDAWEAVTRYKGCKQTIIEGGDHSFQHFADFIDDIIQLDLHSEDLSWPGN